MDWLKNPVSIKEWGFFITTDGLRGVYEFKKLQMDFNPW